MWEVPIAFQGELGAYSHEAIDEFGRLHGITFRPVPTRDLDALFETVSERTRLGIVPVENSSAGLVFSAIDLILQNKMTIIGEQYLPIRHNLLGWRNAEKTNLEGKVVRSHWQALNQSRSFVSRVGLKPEEFYDTAGAAKSVSEMVGDARFNYFAIASAKAAQLYGLEIAAEAIQNNRMNTTRFLIVKPSNVKAGIEKKLIAEGRYKATIFCSVPPEQLWKVLKFVHDSGYLTYTLHSRPIEESENSERVFNRVFYLDVGIPNNSNRGYKELRKNFSHFLERTRKEVGGKIRPEENIRPFGFYPAGKIDLTKYQ